MVRHEQKIVARSACSFGRGREPKQRATHDVPKLTRDVVAGELRGFLEEEVLRT